MITIHELLEDKVYREFFTTPPLMPVHLPEIPSANYWRVYGQRAVDGPWGKREFHTYAAAFRFFKKLKPTLHDGTIQSKGIAWQPPFKVYKVVKGGKPVLDEKGKQVYRRVTWSMKLPAIEEPHLWCTYCRRPTVFRWFTRHHAFPKGYDIATPYQRCTICGASERLVLDHA